MEIKDCGRKVAEIMISARDALGWEEGMSLFRRGHGERGGGDEGGHVGVDASETGDVVEGCNGAGGFGWEGGVGGVAGVILCAPADGDVVRY